MTITNLPYRQDDPAWAKYLMWDHAKVTVTGTQGDKYSLICKRQK